MRDSRYVINKPPSTPSMCLCLSSISFLFFFVVTKYDDQNVPKSMKMFHLNILCNRRKMRISLRCVFSLSNDQLRRETLIQFSDYQNIDGKFEHRFTVSRPVTKNILYRLYFSSSFVTRSSSLFSFDRTQSKFWLIFKMKIFFLVSLWNVTNWSDPNDDVKKNDQNEEVALKMKSFNVD